MKSKEELPAVFLYRHRKQGVRNHYQRYHVNLGQRYAYGNFSNRCDPKLTNYVNRVAKDIEKEKGMKKFPMKICAYYDYDPTSHASWYATEYKSNGRYVPKALEIRLDPRFSAGDLTKFRREATEHELREMNYAVLSGKSVEEAHKLAERREEPVYGKRIGDWDDIENLIDERLGDH